MEEEKMIMRNAFILEIVDFMESQFAKAESDGEQALCCAIMATISSCVIGTDEEE